MNPNSPSPKLSSVKIRNANSSLEMSSGSNSHDSSGRSLRQSRPRQRRSSRPVYNYQGGAQYCNCGFKAPIWVSWTRENPGRRFYGCGKGTMGCGFFQWFDDVPFTSRSKDVINYLLDEIDELAVADGFFTNFEDREERRYAYLRNSFELNARAEGQKMKSNFWGVAAGSGIILMMLVIAYVVLA